jgi:hypothetical protein
MKLKTFKVTIPFSGYVRGEKVAIIKAASESDCERQLRGLSLWDLPEEIIRNDTSCSIVDANIEEQD